MGCWNFKLGNLVLVPQVTRKHVRFCKKSRDGVEMKEGFLGSSQGDGQMGKTPVEGNSWGKLLLASRVVVVGLAAGRKRVSVRPSRGALGCHQDGIQT